MNVLNWRLVRALGELQILTRASYVLLVVVPILAALWPAVKLAVNGERRAIENASQALHSTSAELDATLLRVHQTLPPSDAQPNAPDKTRDAPGLLHQVNRIEQIAKRIEQSAHQHAEDLDKKVLQEPALPWTLAAAFFAALFVVLGHLIYQLYAPEAVRTMTWDAFVASRKDEYAKHPTDDALERARRFIDTRLGRRLEESGRYEADELLRKLYSRSPDERKRHIADMPRERVRSLVALIESSDSADRSYLQQMLQFARERLETSTTDPLEEQSRTMTTIERGARAEYLRLAGQAQFATIVTFQLYGLAVWIIALVIKVQAASVAKAAGLTSIADLFLH